MLIAGALRALLWIRGIIFFFAFILVGMLTAADSDNVLIVYDEWYTSINIAVIAGIISAVAYGLSLTLGILRFFVKRLHAQSSFSIIKRQSASVVSLIGGGKLEDVEIVSKRDDDISVSSGKVFLKFMAIWRYAYKDVRSFASISTEIASMSVSHKKAIIATILDSDAPVASKQYALDEIESLGERSFYRSFDDDVDLAVKYIISKSIDENGEISSLNSHFAGFPKNIREHQKMLFISNLFHVIAITGGDSSNSNLISEISVAHLCPAIQGIFIIEFLRLIDSKKISKSTIDRVLGSCDFGDHQNSIIPILEVIYSSISPSSCKLIYEEICLNKSSKMSHNHYHGMICAMLAFGASMHEEAAQLAQTVKNEAGGWVADIAGLICILAQLKIASRFGSRDKKPILAPSSMLLEAAELSLSTLFAVRGRGYYYSKFGSAIKAALLIAASTNYKKSVETIDLMINFASKSIV